MSTLASHTRTDEDFLPHPPDVELDAVITVADADDGPSQFHFGGNNWFDLNWYCWPWTGKRLSPISVSARAVITADNGQSSDLGLVAVSLSGRAELYNPATRQWGSVGVARRAMGGTIHLDPRTIATTELPMTFSLDITALATARYGVGLGRRVVTTSVHVFGSQQAIN